MYYPISQDYQVQEYEQLRKKFFAEEAARKNKQKLLRQELGLPDLIGKQIPWLHAECAMTYCIPRQQRHSLEDV